MKELTDMVNPRQIPTAGTMARCEGDVTPPPELEGPIAEVANVVASWPGVSATPHWLFHDHSHVDGVDCYVGDEELGHIHLSGVIHLATSPSLGKELVSAGRARHFAYQQGWVCEDVYVIGVEAAIALFKRNYVRLQPDTDL